MAEIHGSAEKEETLVDVELLELPFSAATQAEITEEVGDELKTFVKERLHSIQWKAHRHLTIPRVPAQFREKNKMLYEPTMVSIGPYYHGKESLRVMEELKWRFLQSFIARKKVPMATYLNEMRAIEPLARRCYNESVSLGPDEFSLMLLLDGCFILQYYLRLDKFEVFRVSEFNWTFESIQFDLFLLENQIPFFVIHKLFALWIGGRLNCKNSCQLCSMIFGCLPFLDKLSWPRTYCFKIRHLLHFYYECLVPKRNHNPSHRQPPVVSRKERVMSWLKSQFSCQPAEVSNTNHRQPPVVSRKQRVVSWLKSRFSRQSTEADSQVVLEAIHCATKLHECGVTFRRKNNPSNMFDITFTNGVLEMPHMNLNPYLRIIFTNLFAYEQNLSMVRGIFTSFTNLMDLLVNTEKDVVLLERCGIIDNMFQNEEEAATFFNELNDFGFLCLDRHEFLHLFREVQKYSESTWPKYRARLMHDYFSTPWSSLSVFAGFFLLSLTVVQTIFTVYSAFHH